MRQPRIRDERPGTTFLGALGLGFMAVQAGPQVTVSPTGGSATGLLGWVHYSETDIDGDILGLMGIGPGAIGFAGALPAGTYSFWVQDTGTGTAGYVFELAVGSAPESPMLVLWLAGVAALALRAARSSERCLGASAVDADVAAASGANLPALRRALLRT